MAKDETKVHNVLAEGQKKFNVNLKNKKQRKDTYQQWDTIQRKASGQDESKLTPEEISTLLETVIGKPGHRLTGAALTKRLQLQASSRAIQTVVKVGDEGQKAAIYEAICCDEDKDAKVLLNTCNNKFGYILMTKIIRDIPESFNDLFEKLLKLSEELIVSKKGSLVWEFAYNHILSKKGISNEDRYNLLQRFFNNAVIPRHISALHPGVREATFDKALETLPEKLKTEVLNGMRDKMDTLIKKNLYTSIGLALIVKEYIAHCDEEGIAYAVKSLMTAGDGETEKDAGNFAKLLDLVSTWEGLRVFAQLYGHLTTKEKRPVNTLIMQNEDFAKKLFTTEGIGGTNQFAWLLLLRTVCVLDDTKMSFKMIKSAMKNQANGCAHEARAGEDEARLEDCNIRKFLLGTDMNPKRGLYVAPRGQMMLIKALTLKELDSASDAKKTYHSNVKHLSILELPAPASKKSMTARAKEIREQLSKFLSDFFVQHFKDSDVELEQAVFNGELRDLMSEVLAARAESNDMALLESYILPKLASQTDMALYGRNRVVRAMIPIIKLHPEKTQDIFEAVFQVRLDRCLNTDLVWALVSFCEVMDRPNKKKTFKVINKAIKKNNRPFPDTTKKGEMALAALLKEPL